MDGTLDDLHEPQRSDSVPEAESLVAEHEEWKGGPLAEANAKYEELNGLVQEMAELGSTENPYSALTPEVCWLTVPFSATIDFSLSLAECLREMVLCA